MRPANIPDAHIKLKRAFARKLAAEEKYDDMVRKVQAECAHPMAAHYDGTRHGEVYHPRRICLACMYEEQGSWWSSEQNWRADTGVAKLDMTPQRIITRVDFDTFISLRRPF